MKFYFKLAQEAPQEEASEEEVEKVLTSFSNNNVTEMQKFLSTKKVNPYYHYWFQDAILDPDYLENATVEQVKGPESQYTAIAKFPKTIFDIFNHFVKTQNPDQGSLNSFLSKPIYWYNPETEQRESVTRQQALENVNQV